MAEYNHLKIEKKWQKVWEQTKIYHASNKDKKPKFYTLIEFPYPSGDGLHVGHPRPYIGMDVISRKKRMEGFNVLYPIGWDAFGLPTENYAIKTGKDPRVVTKQNSENFKRQIQSIGISFDWSREINTTDPKYYKWTQWIFLQFLKEGLAYKKKMLINWCPKDKIGLANEEVISGACERCGTAVEKREKEQWMLAITKYADRLDKDLDEVDYLPQIKLAQRNWIGRSEGAEIEFQITSEVTRDFPSDSVKVFTTRPDTIFGATFLALAPELAKKLTGKDFGIKVDTDRENKEKIGVNTGLKAKNPANGEMIPVFAVNYVSADYGTGAIMGVPADDERDREFATKYKLPIVENYKKAGFEDFGKKVTRFKLRDWIFSRQRYWGEPIPVVHCETCGIVPLPEKDLPLELPKVKNYQPTDSGESPLANISKWVNTKCPKCKGVAKRETDTMPNWAGSSWYYLRYTDSKNSKAFADKENLKYWTPVDWYNGGNEHTTLHLLYSRFWHKFLFDLGLVPTNEPYKKRTSHGLILAEGGEKMSKSKGNVVNPDDIIKRYGADTLRLYEMFMGPFDQAIAWSEEAMSGPRRFIERVWNLQNKIEKKKTGSDSNIQKTIKKVGEDIEAMKFNTAISSMMIFVNELDKMPAVSQDTYETLLKLLSPFIPHTTEEIWRALGHKKSVHLEPWPTYNVALIADEEVTVVVQVNGKVRGKFKAKKDISNAEAQNLAESIPEVAKWLVGKQKKFIVVPGKVVNIVV